MLGAKTGRTSLTMRQRQRLDLNKLAETEGRARQKTCSNSFSCPSLQLETLGKGSCCGVSRVTPRGTPSLLLPVRPPPANRVLQRMAQQELSVSTLSGGLVPRQLPVKLPVVYARNKRPVHYKRPPRSARSPFFQHNPDQSGSSTAFVLQDAFAFPSQPGRKGARHSL